MLDLLHGNKLGFIGFGSFGNHLNDVFKLNRKFKIFADTDEGDYAFDSYLDYLDEFSWVICLGYKQRKRKQEIINIIKNENILMPNFFHESIICFNNYEQRGNIILGGSLIDNNVKLGYGNILHNNVIISHDTSIGDGCYFSPSVTVCGNVSVGNNVFFGAGSTVVDNVVIGDNVTIGAGTLISNDIEDNQSVIGNPYKRVSNLNL